MPITFKYKSGDIIGAPIVSSFKEQLCIILSFSKDFISPDSKDILLFSSNLGINISLLI